LYYEINEFKQELKTVCITKSTAMGCTNLSSRISFFVHDVSGF